MDWMASIKRALLDTWHQAGKWPGILFLVGVPVLSLGALYALSGKNVMQAETLYVQAGLIALSVAIFVLVTYNLAAAPYREKRDALTAAQQRVSELEARAGVSAQGVFPDWKVFELLVYLRPDLPPEPQSAWMQTLRDVEDRFSTGQLDAWARKRLPPGSAARSSLEKIDPTYWKDADVLAWSADPRFTNGVHTRRRSLKTEWEYIDLQVSKAQALAIWPEPLAKPRVVERDKKLEEAVAYFMFVRWGHTAWKDTGDYVEMLDLALKWFHQLAADEKMQVWGRRERNHGVHEKIPAAYWTAHHVDMLDLLGDENPKTTNMLSHLQLETFFDPMVSALETENAMRYINDHGGIYAIRDKAS
jgi:hypothetical protein